MRRSGWFGYCVVLVGLLASCGQGGAPGPPDRAEFLARTWPCNVVVVLLDAARADRFGYRGYERPTTPNIDALAERSVIFEQAYAQASGTANSVYSFFTSRYPVFESVPDLKGQNAIFLGDEAFTLFEALAVRHPNRLLLSTNPFVRAQLGYAQGATAVIEDWKPEPGQDRGKTPEYATRVTGPALDWIRAHADEGFFAYLHYLEPHEPYQPPEPYLSRLAREPRRYGMGFAPTLRKLGKRVPQQAVIDVVSDLYDGNLAYVDAHVGALVDSLRTEGLLERTIIVLISDHGEAFWEHGRRGHGHAPYEELVHVPFLVYLPTVRELAGTRVAEPVELVDLMPTLLELMGVPTESMDLVGRSLVDVMLAGEGDPDRAVHSRSNRTTKPVYSIRQGPWKWLFHVESGDQELYDLTEDPGERFDLVAADTADSVVLDRMRERFRVWIAGGEQPDSLASPVDNQMMDEATIEALRSLGYID